MSGPGSFNLLPTLQRNQRNASESPSASIGGNMQGSDPFESEYMKSNSTIVTDSYDVFATLPTLGLRSFAQIFSPPYAAVKMFLLELFCCALYAFVIGYATFNYPGTFVLNVWTRTFAVFIVRCAIVSGWSKDTGATLDLPLLLLVGFTEMFFGPRGGANTDRGILSSISVLGKMLFYGIMQFIGYLVGVALLTAVEGGPVSTSDCLVDIDTVSCTIQPISLMADDARARVVAVLFSLMVFGGHFAGYSFHKRLNLWMAAITKRFVDTKKYEGTYGESYCIGKDHKRYAPLHINNEWVWVATTVALFDALSHLLFSIRLGVGNNWFFWLTTSLFTGRYGQANIYAWPGIVAGLIVFAATALFYMLTSRQAKYRSKTVSRLLEQQQKASAI